MVDRQRYIRAVNLDVVAGLAANERYRQRLVDGDSGGTSCMITYVRVPPAGGSPAGLHVHDVDQHMYVLDGTVTFEVDGQQVEAGPGSLVFYPAGTPHRNWNGGTEPAVMLTVNAPLPEADKPFARGVDAT